MLNPLIHALIDTLIVTSISITVGGVFLVLLSDRKSRGIRDRFVERCIEIEGGKNE